MQTTRSIRSIRSFAFAITAATFVAVATPTSTATATPPAVCSERAHGGPTVGYGLTADQRLVCFKVERPSSFTALMTTKSLTAPDTALVGIDTRPSNGTIVGLGNAGGIYLLDPTESRPQFKARLNIALEGRNFGMDFNPTVDRLRVVSDTGQNLRINVDTGATTVDGFIKTGASRTNGIGAVAYTNNDNETTTATTLYDLDSVNDTLTMQSPPNDGVLTTVGRIGFQGTAVASFDIWTGLKNGKADTNLGFATLDGGGSFFAIDLPTGRSTFIGNFGTDVVGITFPTS
jgi:Domain of unknown function (DUF4394)